MAQKIKAKIIFVICCALCLGSLSSCTNLPNKKHSGKLEILSYESKNNGKNRSKNLEYNVETLTKDGIDYGRLSFGEIGKTGGSLVLGLSGGGPKTFNLWASSDATSNEVGGMMYVGLLERNPMTGEMLPLLAKDYELKDNGKKIIINLRRGLKWSDGVEITSEDVLFTWNVIVKEGFETGGQRESVLIDNKFPEFKALDKYTVSVQLPRPFAPMLGNLSYPIAPAHFFKTKLQKINEVEKQRKLFVQLMGTKDDPSSFVVNGPFKLANYRKQERIEYVRNPDYFAFDATGKTRLPYFDKLTYVITPSADLEFFKFISGEIPLLGVNSDMIKLLNKLDMRKQPFEIYDLGGSNISSFVSFNMSNSVKEPIRSWFNNKNFRKALALSIDRNSMIDSIFLGVGSPLCLGFSANSLYFNDELNSRVCSGKADLKAAKEILSQSGFKLDKKTNKLLDSKGNIVRFSLFTNKLDTGGGLSTRELMTTMIVEQWQKLGIQIDFKALEFNNLVVRLTNTGEWEAVVLGFSGESLLEPHSGANVWRSDGRLHLFDSKPHEKRSWEARIDELMDEGTRYNSFKERKKYYYDLQEIISDENPMIYLVAPRSFIAVSKKIGNFIPSKLLGTSYNLEQWYFKNTEKI